MFKVQIDENEYEVTFQHFPRGCPYPGTECKIVAAHKLMRRGATSLHPRDNYDRNIGRKMSLARALKEANFTKNIRKLFWKEYFNVRGKIN